MIETIFWYIGLALVVASVLAGHWVSSRPETEDEEGVAYAFLLTTLVAGIGAMIGPWGIIQAPVLLWIVVVGALITLG